MCLQASEIPHNRPGSPADTATSTSGPLLDTPYGASDIDELINRRASAPAAQLDFVQGNKTFPRAQPYPAQAGLPADHLPPAAPQVVNSSVPSLPKKGVRSQLRHTVLLPVSAGPQKSGQSFPSSAPQGNAPRQAGRYKQRLSMSLDSPFVKPPTPRSDSLAGQTLEYGAVPGDSSGRTKKEHGHDNGNGYASSRPRFSLEGMASDMRAVRRSKSRSRSAVAKSNSARMRKQALHPGEAWLHTIAIRASGPQPSCLSAASLPPPSLPLTQPASGQHHQTSAEACGMTFRSYVRLATQNFTSAK